MTLEASEPQIPPTVTAEATAGSKPVVVGDLPPKKKKRQPVTSLEEFFSRRSVKPATFLKDMREAERWRFDDEDVRAALAAHVERDKHFAKTTQLVAAAMKDREGRFARPVVEFALDAIRDRFERNPHFARVDLDAVDDPGARLELVARALAPRLGEPGQRAESTNLLVATALCLSHSRALSADAAIETLLAALTMEPTRTSVRQRARLVWLGERPKEVQGVLELVAPSIRRVRRLLSEVRQLEADRDAEREALAIAEAEAVRLRAEVADLQRTVLEANADIEKLQEASRAVSVHADHDAKRLKARLAGLLDDQLRDLVATIEEALSVDPPHVDVAREKADVVVRELERQVTWLRS